LRCLAGLIVPKEGRVRILGQPLGSLRDHARRALRRSFQFVAQDPRESLNPVSTVRDLFVEPAKIHSFPPPSNTVVAEVLESLGFDQPVADLKAGQLSFGQQQRIAVGRAIAAFPGLQLLMLDEPASGLDLPSRTRVLNILSSPTFRTPALTLIIASHDLRLLEEVCDSVLMLREGKVVETWRSRPWSFATPYARLFREASRIESVHDLNRINGELIAVSSPGAASLKDNLPT
jgi:peptide/nickel transport system ATP-binding protein